FQRFGRGPVRWLALAALVPLPWLGLLTIQRQQTRNPVWKKLIREHEKEDFEQRFLGTGERSIAGVMRDAIVTYRDQFLPVRGMHPTRRDAAKVEAALEALGQQEQRLGDLADALARAGPYRSELAEEARTTALEYAQARAELLELAQECLRAGKE